MKDRVLEEKIKEIQRTKDHSVKEAHTLCRELILDGRAEKNQEKVAYGEFYLGETFLILCQMEHVVKHVTKALDYFTKADQVSMVVECQNILGVCSCFFGEYQMGLQYFFKATELIRQRKVRCSTIALDTNIGILYETLGDYEDALRYLREAEKKLQSRKTQEEDSMCRIYLHQAACYRGLSQYQEAWECLRKVQELPDRRSHDGNEICYLQERCLIARGMGNLQEEKAIFSEFMKEENQLVTYPVFLGFLKMEKEYQKSDEKNSAKKILDILLGMAREIDTVPVWLKVSRLELGYLEQWGGEELGEKYQSFYRLEGFCREIREELQLKQLRNQFRMNVLLEQKKKS